jgi:transcriptional regulator
MFVPKLYRNENRKEIIEFVSANNFGILISQQAQKRIIATHIPFICQESGDQFYLTSHMSKSNEQWQTLEASEEVLLIFQGAHTYISSSWYDHVNVPTWDYIAVHLYGKCRLLNETETILHLKELVDQHEATEKKPVSLDSMGHDYVAKEMKGLVAFEIEITDIFSAFKLSQNRNEKNLDLIIAALEERNDENSVAIASALKKVKQEKHHD